MVKKGLVVLAAVVLTASSAYAANVETMGIGAMNTAQAGAVSAYCDNVFAAYYNPAGLSLIERPTISAGAMYYNAKIKVSDWNVVSQGSNDTLDGAPSDYESDTMDIVSPSLGFAMPVTDKLTLGVAAYTPYGLHVTWDKDPANSPSSAYAWESYYGRVAVSPTLSYKVSDKFSVGVGVSLGRSISEAGKTMEYSDDFNPTAIAKEAGGLLTPDQAQAKAGLNALNFTGDAEKAQELVMSATLLDGAQLKMETTDDFNYSFNVGLMYRPIEQLSMGLTYRGRSDGDFEGDVMISGAMGGTQDLDGTVTMEYDHPEQVQAGVRWMPSNKFSVEADVTWTRWSINENQDEHAVINVPDAYVGLVGASTIETTFEHERDWEDTTAYKLGIAYQATEAFVFRAGYTYDPSPVPDETFEFGWPDTDRNVYALGMGWRINERWNLDAVLQHVVSTSKRSTTGESTELNKNYSAAYGAPAQVYCENEGILWGAGMTMTYTF